MPEMTFKEALKILNIEDYGERIFNSNSHGELMHLMDYIMLAQELPETEWFREWFIKVVEMAEKEWTRPESVFQHIPKILANSARGLTSRAADAEQHRAANAAVGQTHAK